MHAVNKMLISQFSPLFFHARARGRARRAVTIKPAAASGKFERPSQARFWGLTLVSRAPLAACDWRARLTRRAKIVVGDSADGCVGGSACYTFSDGLKNLCRIAAG